jgi:hypothetical protein
MTELQTEERDYAQRWLFDRAGLLLPGIVGTVAPITFLSEVRWHNLFPTPPKIEALQARPKVLEDGAHR